MTLTFNYDFLSTSYTILSCQIPEDALKSHTAHLHKCNYVDKMNSYLATIKFTNNKFCVFMTKTKN